MKLVKRINPFGPLSGRVWSGPDSHERFAYYFRSWVFYSFVSTSTVKEVLESNDLNFEDFKKFYKSYCGSPKKVRSGYGPTPKYVWLYKTEYLWDYCFQKNCAEYPYPRLNNKGELVYEKAAT